MKARIRIHTDADQEQVKLAEILGEEPEGGDETLTALEFPASQFGGYWIDPDDGDIVFSVGGHEYRSPGDKDTLEKFKEMCREE